MEQLLFINACVRSERSRTLKLARACGMYDGEV